jgi:Ala-tRNA(Pro) deacylase
MPIQRVKAFLEKEGVPYVTISHARAFTAQQAAASVHIPGQELAKTVIVKLDGRMAMAVLPASCQIDFAALAEVTGAREVTLAEEWEFQRLFPECEVGAMPPFGNLYALDVYVAERLAEDDQIAFNAGSHTELIQMAYRDFERLVGPEVLPFAAGVY